jgi:hypothetical protein
VTGKVTNQEETNQEETNQEETNQEETSRLRRYTSKLGLWSASIAATVVLLAVFMYLQGLDSKFLSLDTKWVIVAAIPLIIAILRSNIIRSFKGFGFELETRLEDPLRNVNLEATDVLKFSPATGKGTLRDLYAQSQAKRQKVERLTFILGRKEYYGKDAIIEYLQELPGLSFLEITEEDGRFVALLPIRLFRNPDQFVYKEQVEIYENQVDNLVKAIENRSVGSVFRSDAITESVRDKDSLLIVLPKVQASKFQILPVIGGSGQLVGTVTTEIVEKSIAHAVIAAQESA